MTRHSVWLIVLALLAPFARAEKLNDTAQAELERWIAEAQRWAADPAIVGAVVAQNAHPSAEVAAMTQEKWDALARTDPTVREFMKNDVGQLLKAKKTAVVTEAFVSDATGAKVGFLGKTTSWIHRGKEKHDVPMTGQVWQGKPELDKSSGMRQVQISVPVLDGAKPVGSLVLGISIEVLIAK